jgi:hypothetical protein
MTTLQHGYAFPPRVHFQFPSDILLHDQRIEPIGYDSKRNAYWLIGGTAEVFVRRALLISFCS